MLKEVCGTWSVQYHISRGEKGVLPKEIAIGHADTPHLIDLGPDTYDPYSHMSSGFDPRLGRLTDETGRGRVGIVCRRGRHQLYVPVSAASAGESSC
jgi:hypothetical protein